MNITENQKYDYVEDRLKKQMNYYHTACTKNKKRYNFFSIANIVITAIIPIFSLAVNDISCFARYAIAVLSAFASICTGVIFFKKYQEQWLEARNANEQLKSELSKYESRTCHYSKLDDEERLNLLVTNCEEIMSSEHKAWHENLTAKK